MTALALLWLAHLLIVAPLPADACVDLSTGCHTQDEIDHWYDGVGPTHPDYGK